MSVEEMLKGTANELKAFMLPENVIGKPVDLGERTVIPVARFGFGFGAGGGTGDKGDGRGAGGGGGMEPVAMIILHKGVTGPDGIQVVALRKESPWAEVTRVLSEKLAPQVIEAFKNMPKEKKEE
jgi:uncharacterized spore protein YtfJ